MNYLQRFESANPAKVFPALKKLGFAFVLLGVDKKSLGTWKMHDADGTVLDKAKDVSLAAAVSHLRKNDGHSLGIVPDGAGVLIADCDDFSHFEDAEPSVGLLAKMVFGKHAKRMFHWTSSREPKGHLFVWCDVDYAHARFGIPHKSDGKNRIHIRSFEHKHFSGQTIGRHYVRVHRPELLPKLLAWRKGLRKKHRLPDSMLDLFCEEPKRHDVLSVPDRWLDHGDRTDFEKFEFKETYRETKARHQWVNIHAASLSARGFEKSGSQRLLLSEIGKPELSDFQRFFDGGWSFGLAARTNWLFKQREPAKGPLSFRRKRDGFYHGLDGLEDDQERWLFRECCSAGRAGDGSHKSKCVDIAVQWGLDEADAHLTAAKANEFVARCNEQQEAGKWL